MLVTIELPREVAEITIPDSWQTRIANARQRIQTFQDRWDRPQIEQFVAADYEHLYQSIIWVSQQQQRIGNRFLEWGCGFAIISAMADALGWDSIGIEAESDLLTEGRLTIAQWHSNAELIHGNFLPVGADRYADDPMLPSLGHPVASAYDQIEMDLDDFAMVYSYPWPGEDEFHQAVFDRYGAIGALQMMFCGPNDIRLWRKVK